MEMVFQPVIVTCHLTRVQSEIIAKPGPLKTYPQVAAAVTRGRAEGVG